MLISATGILSVTAIIVGFSTFGRAGYAFNKTSEISNYTYKVDLYSPTIEGGTYNNVNYTTLHNDLYDKSGKPVTATYDGTKKIPTPADDARLNKPH
jgi:putative ABC transport system permease protein